jgi:hypothetical protein
VAALAYQESAFLEQLGGVLAALGEQALASRVAHVMDQARAWQADEAAAWHETCQGNQPEDYQRYLQRYPQGPHAEEARKLLLDELERTRPGRVFRGRIYRLGEAVAAF